MNKECTLIEIYSEEIPYKTQLNLEKELPKIIADKARECLVTYGDFKVYVTQFRIIIMLYDCNGERVIEFLSNFLQYISKSVLNPKMKWPNVELEWIRPIRNILISTNEMVMKDSNLFGIPVTPILHFDKFKKEIFEPNDDCCSTYFKLLEENGVVLERERRIQYIKNKITELEQQYSIKALSSEKLIYELSSLTESPFAIFAELPEKFLILPYELIDLVLTQNQRYIMFVNNDFTISPHFLIIAKVNNEKNINIIRDGNLRVVNARLEDAMFHLNKDKQERFNDTISRDELKESVSNIIFCGNYLYKDLFKLYDKILGYFSINHKDREGHHNTLKLGKCDLASQLVREYPELQGIIAKHYLYQSAPNRSIWNVFCDNQYKGINLNGQISKTGLQSPHVIIPLLVERLGYIIAMYHIGHKPTSSGDPFTIKRRVDDVIKLLTLFVQANEWNPIQNRIAKLLQELLDKPQYENLIILYKKRLVLFLKSLHDGSDIVTQIQQKIYSRIPLLESSEHLLNVTALKNILKLTEVEVAIYKRISPFCTDHYGVCNVQSIEKIQDTEKKKLLTDIIEKNDLAKMNEYFQKYKITGNEPVEQSVVNAVINHVTGKILRKVDYNLEHNPSIIQLVDCILS